MDGRGSRPAATSLPAPRGRMYLIQAEIKPTASGDAGPHRFPAVEIELAGGSASPALSLRAASGARTGAAAESAAVARA